MPFFNTRTAVCADPVQVSNLEFYFSLCRGGRSPLLKEQLWRIGWYTPFTLGLNCVFVIINSDNCNALCNIMYFVKIKKEFNWNLITY